MITSTICSVLDFFKDHPIGRPICGRQETVKRFQRGDFVDFFKTRYRPSRVIVAAAGNFRHDHLVAEMTARLGMVGDGSEPIAALLDGERKPAMASGHLSPLQRTRTGSPLLGYGGLSLRLTRGRYPAYVLNTLLGGGMSSRLFQEIREKRGKAYSVYSFSSSYKDVGYLGVYAWHEHRIDGRSRSIWWSRNCANWPPGEITDDELARTRGQLVGGMMLGLESTDSWMSHIARNEIYFGKTVTTEEICQRIRAVSRDDVIQLADSLFHPEEMTLTLLGDFRRRL
jgi:predicted Zn-dependent peptidase